MSWTNKGDENDKPKLECHINLWNLKINKKRINPFIDFGISIPNFRNVKMLDFLLPFKFNENEIFDLYDYVKNPETARLIFNEIECEISSKDRYTIINSDNFSKEKLLISLKNNEGLEKFIRLYNDTNDMSRLLFSFDELKRDKLFIKYTDVYFRFRVNSESIEKALFCPIQKKNWFLESGFTETQIIDIKINQERNLPHELCKDYRLKNFKFASFSKIHLFIMTNSSNEVDTFGNGVYECRKLEEMEWNSYLGNNYDVINLLAYHWKDKNSDKGGIKNFNKLIRISNASTNMKVIITYIMIVIVLGMIGSGSIELIKLLF